MGWIWPTQIHHRAPVRRGELHDRRVVHRDPRVRAGAARRRAVLALVAGGLLAAYAVALATNTLRIVIALWLRDADLGPRDAVHHLEGVIVYVVCLCACTAAARRALVTPDAVR